jgi:hypothetical protein
MPKGLSIKTILVAAWVMSMLCCASTEREKEATPMRELVPSQIHGWKTQEEVEAYNRETIFDYMDGAGEIYLMYDFRELMVFHMVRASQSTILVEIFDMGSSQEAFGIFSHAQEGQELGIGQGSEYRGGVLSFWKGNYFVCVYSEGETPEIEETIPVLAGEIAGRITVTGDKPALLNYLPGQGLQPETIRFFHKHTSLNYHYFLASDNILQLDQHTRAVLAKYQPGQSMLLCVLYEDEIHAQSALRSFQTSYLPELGESQTAQTDDGKWVAAESKGPFVLVVFAALTSDDAVNLLKAIEAKIPKQ